MEQLPRVRPAASPSIIQSAFASAPRLKKDSVRAQDTGLPVDPDVNMTILASSILAGSSSSRGSASPMMGRKKSPCKPAVDKRFAISSLS
jgi:hypothetical protein